jgi:two-component system response regulator YesN
MDQERFSRLMAGGQDAGSENTWFQATLTPMGELIWEGRRCTLAGDAAGFRGGRHRGAAGLRLSFYEAVQTENCNRYRTPFTDFALISGDVGAVDKSPARIQVEKRIVRDIENERGAHLSGLIEEWFDTEPDADAETLRLLVMELHHVIKWKLFDALSLGALRVKRGFEVYEILNVPTAPALRQWMRDWVRYTFSIVAPLRDEPRRRVARAMRYMEENVESHPKVREVAAHLNMDPAYFSNVFKREAGLSPSAYMLHLRLDKAEALLKSGVPVGQTWQRLGFCDPKAFRAAFKARFGIPPSRVRQAGPAN